MISGALNVEECCKTLSHGRVSGCDAKHLSYNCGVMDGKAEEEIPVLTGPEVSSYNFSNAVKTAAEKNKKIYKKME